MDGFKFIFFMAAKWHDSENDLLSVQMYMLVLNLGCEIQNFCGNFISLSKEFERNLRDTCIRFLERFSEKSSTISFKCWKLKRQIRKCRSIRVV